VRPYNKTLKQFSRTLRSNMTDAEQHLWFRLRNKQLGGVQFYRQKPLLSFIVDFYCPRAKLVIELDGSQHLEAEHQIRDAARDEELAKLGIKVLRFDDRQVLRETEAVVAVIYDEVMVRLKSSNLP
jgi:very-short-patch-repair endonuclease